MAARFWYQRYVCVCFRQSSVRVRKHGDAVKHSARLLFASHDSDLAVLTVDDDDFGFWDGLVPLKLSDSLPALHDTCSVLGYPDGADALSVTKGVVSRIVMVPMFPS
jgi:S1-C subfamily serine protease